MGSAQNETADVQAGKITQLFGQLRFKVQDLLDLFDVDSSGIGQFQRLFIPNEQRHPNLRFDFLDGDAQSGLR